MSAFSKAFAAARAKLGSGQTFEFNGKTYSTDTADNKATSPARPKARPASAVESNTTSPGGAARGPARAAASSAVESNTTSNTAAPGVKARSAQFDLPVQGARSRTAGPGTASSRY